MNDLLWRAREESERRRPGLDGMLAESPGSPAPPDPRMTRVLEASVEFERTMTQLRAFAAQFEKMLASMRALRASIETLPLPPDCQIPGSLAPDRQRPDLGPIVADLPVGTSDPGGAGAHGRQRQVSTVT